MNPNTCTICELMFTRVMKARRVKIDVSVLSADLRGYTALSQTSSAESVSSMLDYFYDECATAIWDFDGLLNKTSGDGLMAIFNFPIPREDHADRAVLAAQAIRRSCLALREGVAPEDAAHAGSGLSVGMGIDCGEISFGEFGRSHRDLTAIGTVVNTAARAQSAAKAGEILITKAVRERISGRAAESEGREYDLKGLGGPVALYSV